MLLFLDMVGNWTVHLLCHVTTVSILCNDEICSLKSYFLSPNGIQDYLNLLFTGGMNSFYSVFWGFRVAGMLSMTTILMVNHMLIYL